MSPIEPHSTLGAIVTDHPGLARELEDLGLDYCCGGRRTLAQACAGRGLDAFTVAGSLNRLTDTAPPADWATMTAVDLVDHIESTHHAYLHRELPRLTALADKVVAAHGARHPELADVTLTYAELRADLGPHLAKEERILFPMIRELFAGDDAPSFHCGTLTNPIRVMLFEHDRAGELLARIRKLTGAHTVPADACASYRALYAGLARLEADTHLHVHKENNLLFPEVIAHENRLSARRAG